MVDFFFGFLTEPVQPATLSFIGWKTIWKHVGLIQFHPFSRILGRHPKVKRILLYVVLILKFLQWVASLYMIASAPGLSGGKYQRYDCLPDRFSNSPGTYIHDPPIRLFLYVCWPDCHRLSFSQLESFGAYWQSMSTISPCFRSGLPQ